MKKKTKNFEELISSGELKLKEADFGSKKFGKKIKKLKKAIAKIEKESEVDYEDLKKIVFKPKIGKWEI